MQRTLNGIDMPALQAPVEAARREATTARVGFADAV
jgi:hypothetical protein